MNNMFLKHKISGNGLRSNTLKRLLEASYSGEKEVEGFLLDPSISSKTSKVYIHPSGHVVVAHQGTTTASDWGNNIVYGAIGEVGYKMTPRYKEAYKVQQNAEKKYGAKNISTIGHSQGALQAQLLGGKTREIITLNKATRPQETIFGSSKKKNQYDVRASGDMVSFFRSPFQRNRDQTIKSNKDPLTQHSTDILDKSKDDIVYGDRNFYIN